jgi:hypothetical protein
VDDPHERFASLYDHFYQNVLRYTLQHAEPHTAEDVASEVFIVAWRRLDGIPEPALPWLLGVARNLMGIWKVTASRNQGAGALRADCGTCLPKPSVPGVVRVVPAPGTARSGPSIWRREPVFYAGGMTPRGRAGSRRRPAVTGL